MLATLVTTGGSPASAKIFWAAGDYRNLTNAFAAGLLAPFFVTAIGFSIRIVALGIT